MFAHPTCLTGLQALQVIGMDSLMCPSGLSCPLLQFFSIWKSAPTPPCVQGTYTGICPVPN